VAEHTPPLQDAASQPGPLDDVPESGEHQAVSSGSGEHRPASQAPPTPALETPFVSAPDRWAGFRPAGGSCIECDSRCCRRCVGKRPPPQARRNKTCDILFVFPLSRRLCIGHIEHNNSYRRTRQPRVPKAPPCARQPYGRLEEFYHLTSRLACTVEQAYVLPPRRRLMSCWAAEEPEHNICTMAIR
jgi:hypothetical protein